MQPKGGKNKKLQLVGNSRKILASRLFNKSKKSGTPAFSKDVAENYFSNLYHDSGRDASFEPLPGMRRPECPRFVFSQRCPTRLELRKSVLRKRNGSVLGSIPF